MAVIDHRRVALVAALLQDALRRDVGHHVVGVGRHPDGVPALRRASLLLQAERVIDDDLAAQRDPDDLVAEPPHLHRVVRIVVVESCPPSSRIFR